MPARTFDFLTFTTLQHCGPRPRNDATFLFRQHSLTNYKTIDFIYYHLLIECTFFFIHIKQNILRKSIPIYICFVMTMYQALLMALVYGMLDIIRYIYIYVQPRGKQL